MSSLSRTHFACLLAGALLGAATLAQASPTTEQVVQSTDFGTLTLPYTNGFSWALTAPSGAAGSDGFFLSDYGFSISGPASFSAAVLSFDLGATLQLSDLSLTLLRGTAWSGALSTTLSAADIADRDARVLTTGFGNPVTQTLSAYALDAGNYVVEVRGRVTGTGGGSFGGVLNVSAVPEPDSGVLALAGFGLLAWVARRTRR